MVRAATAAGFCCLLEIMVAGSSKLKTWHVGEEELMDTQRFMLKFDREIKSIQKSVTGVRWLIKKRKDLGRDLQYFIFLKDT